MDSGFVFTRIFHCPVLFLVFFLALLRQKELPVADKGITGNKEIHARKAPVFPKNHREGGLRSPRARLRVPTNNLALCARHTRPNKRCRRGMFSVYTTVCIVTIFPSVIHDSAGAPECTDGSLSLLWLGRYSTPLFLSRVSKLKGYTLRARPCPELS